MTYYRLYSHQCTACEHSYSGPASQKTCPRCHSQAVDSWTTDHYMRASVDYKPYGPMAEFWLYAAVCSGLLMLLAALWKVAA